MAFPSSVLTINAGVVLSAACVAAGRAMSSTSLIHAVLRVEQLMTAGEGRHLSYRRHHCHCTNEI